MDFFLDLHSPPELTQVLVMLSFFFIIYFIFFKFANWPKVNLKHLVFTAIFFNFIFLLVPFLTSNDLYSYIFQTRIYPIFHQNPYLVPYDYFNYDVIYNSVKTIWSTETNLHGPLFLLIGGVINLLGKNNLNLLIFLFKFILISANIFSSFLIYKITKNLPAQAGKKALYLFGLNPLVIFELSGNAHADSLLILFMLLSFFYLKINKLKSLPVIFLSALIKYSTLMFLPLQILFSIKLGLKKLIITLLVSILISIAIWLPFWEGPQIFDYLFKYYNGKFISPSLGIFLGEKLLNSYQISFQINNLIFIITYFFLLIKFYFSEKKFETFIFYSFIIFWIYLLTKLSLVLAWDLTPLIALASLCFVYKKYKKIALSSIIFVTIYSIGLYWFVK